MNQKAREKELILSSVKLFISRLFYRAILHSFHVLRCLYLTMQVKVCAAQIIFAGCLFRACQKMEFLMPFLVCVPRDCGKKKVVDVNGRIHWIHLKRTFSMKEKTAFVRYFIWPTNNSMFFNVNNNWIVWLLSAYNELSDEQCSFEFKVRPKYLDQKILEQCRKHLKKSFLNSNFILYNICCTNKHIIYLNHRRLLCYPISFTENRKTRKIEHTKRLRE